MDQYSDIFGTGRRVPVSAVIPAYNEKLRIAQVITEARPFVDEVIVVDDGSTDGTGEVAQQSGARVIRQEQGGYLLAIKAGFAAAAGEVVVTLDADGEHDPRDIPRLLEPLLRGQADLALGRRPRIDRPSERLITWLVRFKVPVADSGCGFRAFRRDLALGLTFPGWCICGASVLEAHSLGARIIEVPISPRTIPKPRRIAWGHLRQLVVVLRLLLQGR
jgi:glycosyltransferase involved in cell wall biosynthesis